MDLSVTGTADFMGAGGESGEFPVGITANLVAVGIWDGISSQNITSYLPDVLNNS